MVEVVGGAFINGLKCGFGVLISSDESYRYEGNWNNNLKNGQGKEFYPDGSYYDGEFKDNVKCGMGIF